MDMHPVKSSNLDAIGYDESGKVLAVRFKGNPMTYHYHGVPPEKFEALKTSSSKGGYFAKHVRNVHKVTKTR